MNKVTPVYINDDQSDFASVTTSVAPPAEPLEHDLLEAQVRLDGGHATLVLVTTQAELRIHMSRASLASLGERIATKLRR